MRGIGTGVCGGGSVIGMVVAVARAGACWVAAGVGVSVARSTLWGAAVGGGAWVAWGICAAVGVGVQVDNPAYGGVVSRFVQATIKASKAIIPAMVSFVNLSAMLSSSS